MSILLDWKCTIPSPQPSPKGRGRVSAVRGGEKTFGDFGSFQSHSPRPEGRAKPRRGRRPRVLRGKAMPSGISARSGVRINSAWIANVRIRCAIRTYDSITPGYDGSLTLTSPKGRGDKDVGSGNKQEIEREPIRLPFLRNGQWHVTHAAPYLLVAAFIPSTNSFKRVSICSGFWWWVSMIFTTAEPEMAPAAPAAMASRT